jgi:hypothetical protein
VPLVEWRSDYTDDVALSIFPQLNQNADKPHYVKLEMRDVPRLKPMNAAWPLHRRAGSE